MDREAFEEHLTHPVGRGRPPGGSSTGTAGGAPCGDLLRVSVRIDGDTVTAASFDASGCGAALAAGSAAVALVQGARALDAARIGPAEIAAELGGLSPGKLHAAELAAEALARALGSGIFQRGSAPEVEERSLVAMSGGVDSAVAALLAIRRGDEAVAVTLELWRDEQGDPQASCCSASAVTRARRVAQRMGMPHLTIDLRDEFRSDVVDPWLAAHREGRTPNPCIACNGHLRLDAMLGLADRVGAARLVTGHYARTGDAGELLTAADEGKDQSFMLAALAPRSLERMDFPLGTLQKDEVRQIARRECLEVADAPDSQDLCFLAGVGRSSFLERFAGLGERPGEIVDSAGRPLGRHSGAHRFTVGQRRGLEIGGLQEPLYVLATDLESNRVTVGPRSELESQEIPLVGVRLDEGAASVSRVRLRSHGPAVACRLEAGRLRLENPVRAPAPGQTAVFLSGERIVGCATIA